MRLKGIRIRNHRSLEGATVGLDGLTMPIGANNSGKATVLGALGLFGSSAGRIGAGDFDDPETPVDLELTMPCEGEKTGIPARFCINGELAAKKSLFLGGDRVALGHLANVMPNPGFDGLREQRPCSRTKVFWGFCDLVRSQTCFMY